MPFTASAVLVSEARVRCYGRSMSAVLRDSLRPTPLIHVKSFNFRVDIIKNLCKLDVNEQSNFD
jgi:hypothetical protein